MTRTVSLSSESRTDSFSSSIARARRASRTRARLVSGVKNFPNRFPSRRSAFARRVVVVCRHRTRLNSHRRERRVRATIERHYDARRRDRPTEMVSDGVDDGFVMNLAGDSDGWDSDGGASSRKGNPMRRTVKRSSKKGWRGGGGGGGNGGVARRDDDDTDDGRRRTTSKKRAREDRGADDDGRPSTETDAGEERNRGERKGKRRSKASERYAAKRAERRDGATGGNADRRMRSSKGTTTTTGGGGCASKTRRDGGGDDDDGFEVVGEADAEDGATESLTFNPKDWASLMKSAAGEGGGDASGRIGDDDGDGGEETTRRARVFGREAKTFDECGLPTSLVKHLTENVGFGAPTKVQAMTIPRLLAGRDVLVRAETGSGKTLSYIAPLFSEIGRIAPRVTRREGTRGLVLVPTRELATQVEDTAKKVGRPFHWVVTSSIMGGENRAKEKARLRKGVCLLIATPGRLLDHLRMTESFMIDNLRWLVLDEADRLLDLGFEEDLNAILTEIGKRTEGASLCTALLSATLTPGTARLAERMVDPVTIVIEPEKDDLEIVGGDDGDENTGGTMDVDGLKRMAKIMAGGDRVRMPEGLNHTAVEVSMKARLPALAGLLAGWMQGSIKKAIVFFSSCESVEFHYKTLRWLAKGGKGKMEEDDDSAQGPYEIFRLHGLLSQGDRTSVFRHFAETKAGVLLCTDVGARGLDFVGVGATVQVDPPNDLTTYIHRVGRTARLGSDGEAVLFLQPKEREFKDVLSDQGKVRFISGSVVSMLNVLDAAVDATERDKSMFKSMPHLHPAAQRMTKKLASKVASDKPYNGLASDAFRAYVRAYATFPSAVKHIFHVKRLHLGHVAAAFGLKDAPQLIGASATKAALKAQKEAARKKLKSDARAKKQARQAKKSSKLASGGVSFRPIGQ